jgi:hemerythrin-like metal-binding protein
MAFMEWTDECSVGVRKFDDDHKMLFSIANELHKAIGVGIDKNQLILILDRVDALSAQHFKHEETAFDTTGYPNAATHKGHHNVALAMSGNFRAEVLRAGASHHALELLLLLKGWFLLHVQQEDREFGAFLNSRDIR